MTGVLCSADPAKQYTIPSVRCELWSPAVNQVALGVTLELARGKS